MDLPDFDSSQLTVREQAATDGLFGHFAPPKAGGGWLLGAAAMLVFSVGTTTAYAKDAVRATIAEADGGIVTENGGFQTPGTYAVGTIKINYMIIGEKFPADTVKTFKLCLDVIEGKSKPATAYDATVKLAQVGTPDVMLGLSSSSMVFSGPDTGSRCTDVAVSIPESVANDPDFQEDGTELVANLQLSTGPRTHLDTVTTIKVHLTLVHPSETACIVPLHLVANNDLTSSLSETGITLSVHMSNGLTTNHQGRHVVALVNTCAEPVTLGLNTALNQNFSLQSAAAVKTTTVNQQFDDINEFLEADLAGYTNQGTNLCLPNLNIPGGQTFVVNQHIRMNSDAAYPGTGINDWFYDSFTYAALMPNTCGAPALSSDVAPNPGEVCIPIKRITYSGKDALPAQDAPSDEICP